MSEQVFKEMHKRIPLYYMQESYKFTPDLMDLKRDVKDEFLVLIIGQMQQGRPLSHALLGANYYGKGVTTGSDYLMKKVSPMGPPFVIHLQKRVQKNGLLIPPHMVGRIEGDVVGLPLRMITKLDMYEENGVMTNRLKRYVRLQHPTQGNQAVSCFVYLGNQDYYEESFDDLAKLPGVSTMEQDGTKRFYYI